MLYANEWADSIRESHEESPEREYLVEDHWRSVHTIIAAFSDHLPLISQYLPIAGDRCEVVPGMTESDISWL